MQNSKYTSKTNVYICYTLYHLLISLIYSSTMNDKKSKIVILTRIANAETYLKKIQYYYPIIDVVVVDDELFKKKGFFYSKEIHQLYQYVIGDGLIHIFNDWTQIGYYLHRNRISYTLMEDGLNCMHHPTSVPKWTFRTMIRNFLENTPNWNGYSPYCTSIVVNEITGIPMDSRYPKFVEVSKKELLSQLSHVERKKLLLVFGGQPLVIKEPAVLILTQPLFMEFPDDTKKREFWGNLIRKYSGGGYHVYVKVHPRDTLSYTIFPVTILPKHLPAELLDFIVDKQFAIGVTYYSTALEYMDCVQEKVYLCWEK
ncbi:glycosyltransferase family 52 [Streptococcus suis]